MFRGVSINPKDDEPKAVLYKNRREELCEIPNEYIESIEYKLRDCFTMTLSVPSKVQRRGEVISNPLFDKFKPKRQIIYNGDRYEICGDFKVESNKHIKKKKFTAKSFEINLNKKDVAVQEGTFQLYKSKGDKIDVEEGVLNWLENETSWKVGYIDPNAKSTIGLFNETIDIDLYNNLNVKDVQVDKILFDKDVYINIPDQVLNFSIKYNNIISTDFKSNVTKTENYEHKFENFAEGIRHIKASYSIDNSYNTVIRYEFTLINGFIKKEVEKFTYLQGLDINFKDIVLTYETGNKVEKTKTKYRSFEKGIHQWLPFLRDMVEKAYDCIFQFDTINKLVNVYDRQTMGRDNGFYLYYDQYLMKIDKDLKSDDIVTRLVVEGKDGLSINGVNPLGTNYIEDFTYLLKQGNISDELQMSLQRYNNYINKVFDEWDSYKKKKDGKNKQSIYIESKLQLVRDQLEVKKSIKIAYIKAGEDRSFEQQMEFKKLEAEIEVLNNDLNSLIKTLNILKEEIKQLDINMGNCNNSLDKKTAKDVQGVIFTEEDLDELDECIYSLRLSDDYYTDDKELFDNAKRVLNERNMLPIDFTTDVVGLTRHPRGWKNIVKLGDVAHIMDGEEEIEGGEVRITGFKYTPSRQNSQAKISSVEFNNSKFVLHDLKTIRNISLNKINRSANAINLYRNTWVDSSVATNNLKNIQKYGIQANSIPIKCNQNINELDITGTGVWCTDKTDKTRKKQFYMGAGFFAVTNDNWKTCKTVADEKGLVAKSIMGTAILGERMKLVNPNKSIKIDDYGISVYDSSKTLRARVGIYSIRGENKSSLILYDKNEKVVLSGDGMLQNDSLNFCDNVDQAHPIEFPIYLYENIELREAKLFLHLSNYRVGFEGVEAGGSIIKTTNMNSGVFTYLSSASKTQMGGENITINKSDIEDLLNDKKPSIQIVNKHYHLEDNHKHGLPNHNHVIQLPNHKHEPKYKIIETTMPTSIGVYVNDKLVASNINEDCSVEISKFLETNKLNIIKITTQTNGRINCLLSLSEFINF
ncbi:phage tail protein [Clostridium perfringens]|jgi:hypothetical protein|uniref:Prophage tail endopeptidase domain-containing protein n=1 Tax=Clostridium perfringens TaxID=1502 RepID=A0AAW4IXU7_CLOPF|nr:phage tail protein [Clostridium perfringens]MBO3356242.1 hypothetical protein [Clostridium perfringens]MBO3359417.1 hypothetical protein [Clostridium perfringens]